MRVSNIFFSKTRTHRYPTPSFSKRLLRRNSRADCIDPARRPRSEQRLAPRLSRFSQRGFSTLGGCLALLTILAGVGLYELMHKIQNLTHLQVNLDQCTGTFIANLRAATLTMNESYQRLEVYRVAVVGGCLANPLACPELLQKYNDVAKIEREIQEGTKSYWSEQKGVWNGEIFHRCSLPLFTRKNKFPDFTFPIIQGSDADLVSLQSTRYLLAAAREPTLLSLRYLNLISTAELKYKGAPNAWSIRWSQ